MPLARKPRGDGSDDVLKTVAMAGAVMVVASWMAGGAVTSSLKRAAAAAPVERPEDARPGRVALRASPDGHFRVDALVAGKKVPMMVDTGATVVALSYEQGQELGLVWPGDRFDGRVQTANGAVGVKRVVLRDVRIGSVRVEDVSAVVLSRGAMDGALLGMSFLGRLRRLETTRDKLVMER